MLWLWLLLRSQHSASTGNYDRPFTFACGHCGVSYAGSVRTFGHGSGRTREAAQQNALRVAEGHAASLAGAVACPCCGKLPVSTLALFEAARVTAQRHAKLRLPVSIGVAIAVLLLLGIFGIRDLDASPALLLVAVFSALAAAGFCFARLSRRTTLPFGVPAGVWLSADPARGPSSWFAAQGAPPPIPIAQPPAAFGAGGFVVGGTMVVAAILALIMWKASFRHIYVVSTGSAIDVSVDGKKAERFGDSHYGSDVPFHHFEVRTNRGHHVKVVDEAGVAFDYDLDPASASYGWVLAPHARERGLCVVQVTTYYGRKPRDDGDKVLNEKAPGDVAPLGQSYDNVFVPPPKTMKVKSEGATQTSLRALVCKELANDRMVPWSDKR